VALPTRPRSPRTLPTIVSMALLSGLGAGCFSGPSSDIDDFSEAGGNRPANRAFAQVNITTLPGASENAGAKGEFVNAGVRFGNGAAPTLSNAVLSSVPGAPAKPLFVGQRADFDTVIVAVRGRSGHFEVPAGGNDLVALDLVGALQARGQFQVVVATKSGNKISAPAQLTVLVDPHVFVASGDLENHDADGSNIADLFAPFLEGNQGNPAVAEQSLDAEDNNETVVDGVNGPEGPLDEGHREVVWDGVPRQFRNRGDFSPQFFNRQNDGNVGVRGGIVFQDVNGRGQEVNDAFNGQIPDLDDPLPEGEDDEAPLGGDFSNVNPKFAGNLLSFTQSAQFATRGTTVTDITFKVAGTRTKGFVNGLGIVFASVDRATSTSVEYFDDRGRSIIKIFAPVQSKGPFPFAGPVNADKFPYSFVGFNDLNRKISRVRVVCGEVPIDRASDDLPRGNKDVVAFDDVYYAEPRP